jgi:hypothetical protein
MVMENVETGLYITNGGRREVVDVVLHPEEPPLDEGQIVGLKYLPAHILVKLTRTRATRLEGLADQVMPVTPSE